MVQHIVIKHSAYLKRLTLKGKIACTKRHSEIAIAELLINTGRLTNPNNNFLVLFKTFCKFLSVRNYVVFLSQDKFSILIMHINYKKGSPKLFKRRKQVEFAMTRNLKKWGLRKIHSTEFFFRKESSHIRFEKRSLSGLLRSNQSNNSQFDSNYKLKHNNLSEIISDPEFLRSAHDRVCRQKERLDPSFKRDSFQIKDCWFKKVSKLIRNGTFQFSFQKKKLSTLKLSVTDETFQEALRFLLTLIFEKELCDSVSSKSHGVPLARIESEFNGVGWYIQASLNWSFYRLNPSTLFEVLKTKIKDQAFLDLISKCLKANYYSFSDTNTREIFLLPQNISFHEVLLEICLNQFDRWAKNELLSEVIKNSGIHQTNVTDYDSLQIRYIRYRNSLMIGVEGSKNDCKKIVQHCSTSIDKRFKLPLYSENFRIVHNQKKSVMFLDYCICRRDSSKKAGNIILRAPIGLVVNCLIKEGFAKKGGVPTRNNRFVNSSLCDIVKFFQKIEKQILCYYYLADNYNLLASKTHYVLKYSCALTIASKMKLKTLKKVFNKYGRDLKIKNQQGTIVACYPTVKHKKFKN